MYLLSFFFSCLFSFNELHTLPILCNLVNSSVFLKIGVKKMIFLRKKSFSCDIIKDRKRARTYQPISGSGNVNARTVLAVVAFLWSPFKGFCNTVILCYSHANKACCCCCCCIKQADLRSAQLKRYFCPIPYKSLSTSDLLRHTGRRELKKK